MTIVANSPELSDFILPIKSPLTSIFKPLELALTSCCLRLSIPPELSSSICFTVARVSSLLLKGFSSEPRSKSNASPLISSLSLMNRIGWKNSAPSCLITVFFVEAYNILLRTGALSSTNEMKKNLCATSSLRTTKYTASSANWLCSRSKSAFKLLEPWITPFGTTCSFSMAIKNARDVPLTYSLNSFTSSWEPEG
ncbi:hypothetical protein OGAPHI_007438 [Ogataea philodendri]|uniref:Uncharacterized protein n=1 Tax=Ogataea philodendri TaxID=1378263 RepID=A0A9P8NTT4_9ASCO|nr:uncharacterized protein OGAPHI_007438 [Ogataea philodendri]KAH3660233.1 hypothetical protein OGAPHI_007438 [Ogataea philodendri]